jgi:hypothetical protein
MQKCMFVSIQLETTVSGKLVQAHCASLEKRAHKIAENINNNRAEQGLIEFPILTFCDVSSRDGRVRIEAGCFKF